MVTFQDLLNEKGDAFIEKLFTMPVTVYEKLDASQFNFERDEQGKFSFFKQGQNTPISKIDITLMQYYTPAIKHIQNLPADKLQMIPVGWRFCCEYFVDRSPVYISYDKLPLNNLVLINIIDNTSDGKKVIDNKKMLEDWADFLDIEGPPIIYQGHIGENQKMKIMEFVKTPKGELINKFQTDSFIHHVLSILAPDKKHSFLRNDDSGLVEGVVFKFGGESDVNYSAKIIDPVFYSKKIESHPGDRTEPSDVYWLTLIDMVEYLQGINLDTIDVTGDDAEERYLDIICKLFNGFVEKYGKKYTEVDFDLPKFMQRDAFRVGMDYVPNKITKSIILKDDSLQNVFKVMVAAFRKKRKNPNHLITQYVLNRFNQLVDDIAKISKSIPVVEDEDSENGILTFDQMKRYGKISDVKESDDSGDFETPLVDNSKASQQFQAFNEDGQDYSDREHRKVCVILDSFEFFTNQHLDEINRIKNEYNHNVVLVNIRTDNTLTNEDIQKRVLDSVLREYSTKIDDVLHVRTSDISEILSHLLYKEFEPIDIIVPSDIVEYLEKQAATADVHGINVSIRAMAKDANYSKLYKFVMDNSWADFRKYVPPVVLNYFEAYKIRAVE